MAGVRAQLERQKGGGSEFYLVGHKFSAADILLVHCVDWAESITAISSSNALAKFSSVVGLGFSALSWLRNRILLSLFMA